MKNNNLLFSLIFLIILALFIPATAPTITYDDAGEYAISAYFFGIAHPPGYPLYIMISHVFSRLFPFGDIAFRLNILSLIFFALSCATVTIYVFKLTRKKIFILTIPLLWTGYPTLVNQSLVSEIQTLNLFIISIISISTYHAFMKGSAKPLYLASFMAGISCGNHHTSLLLIPFGFSAILYFGKLHKKKMFLHCFLLFIIGSTILLVPPLRSMYDPYIDWGNVETFKNYSQSLTRYQYLKATEQNLSFFSVLNLSKYWFQKCFQGISILLPLGLISIFLLYSKRKIIISPGIIFNILYFFSISGLFLILLNPEISKQNDFYLEIFLTVSISMAGLFMLMALIRLLDEVKNKIHRRTLYLLLIFFQLYLSVLAYKNEEMSSYYIFYDYINFAFKTIPSNSVVLIQGDPYTFTVWYYQFLKNKLTSHHPVNIQLLALPWYGSKLLNELKIPQIYKKGLYNARYISNLRTRHIVENLIDTKKIFSLSHSKNLLSAGYIFEPNNLSYELKKNEIVSDINWKSQEKNYIKNFRIRGIKKHRYMDYASLDATVSIYNCFYNNGVFAANDKKNIKYSQKWFLRALQIHPRGFSALVILSEFAYESQHYELALKYLQKADKYGKLSIEKKAILKNLNNFFKSSIFD